MLRYLYRFPLRVLIVTDNPYLASTTRPLHAAINTLIRNGVEPVFLFGAAGPWQRELSAMGFITIVRPLTWPTKWRPLRSLTFVTWLARLISHLKIDCVHCNEHEHYPALRHAAWITWKPVLVTLHTVLTNSFSQWAFTKRFSPKLLQFLSLWQWQLSRPNIPTYFQPDRISITGTGLCIDTLHSSTTGRNLRVELGIPDNKVVLGVAATLRSHKQLDHFIHLVHQLYRRGLPVVGLVAGGETSKEPHVKAHLSQLIRTLGIEHCCRLVGHIYPCSDFYRALDIYIHTSRIETLSMSIIEAQAFGLPCLAYNTGGNPEVISNAEHLAPLEKVEGLMEAALPLIQDKDLRKIRGAQAAQFVRDHFDASIYAPKLSALYEKLASLPT